MAIKKSKSYRMGFLGFFTILCYCLCITIGIVWVSVGYVFASGGFDEKKIQPKTLFFEYDALPFEDQDKQRNDCLRISGITEEVKEAMIANADASERQYLEQNILVDRTFTVRCTPDDANVLEVDLYCSDPSIATVPETVNIGEPVVITPTLVDGVNKGGFVEIRAHASNGVYADVSLKVLIDVPVDSLGLSLPSTFKSEVVAENPQEPEQNGGNEEPQAQGLGGLDSVPALETVYYMYEGDQTTILNSINPCNALNPTTNAKSVFNSYLQDNKVVSYFLDDPNGYGVDFQLNSQTGEIVANKAGIYKIWAKVLKTYDDEIYVDDYKFEYDFETVIPQEKLIGRYVYSYIYIQVKPIVLEQITVNNNLGININLFESITLSASDLDIQLLSNRNETSYFASDINKLILESSDDTVLRIEKIQGTSSWKLTALGMPTGLNLTLYHPDYPEITCEIEDVDIEPVDISKVELQGTSKQSSSSEYNDLVEIEIQKITEEGVESIAIPGSWDFSNAVTITSTDKNLKASYTVYKLFAVGYYTDTEYIDFLNYKPSEPESGDENGAESQQVDNGVISVPKIISLGTTFYQGLGYEITNSSQQGLYTFIEALNRGTIRVWACVIKTDIDGNPLDDNGNIITSSEQSYVRVANSNYVDVTVIELLRTLVVKTNVISTSEGQPQSEVEIQQENKVVVEIYDKIDINLYPNSSGAILDALKFDLLKVNAFASVPSGDDLISFECIDYLLWDIKDNVLSISFESPELLEFKPEDKDYVDVSFQLQFKTVDDKYETLKTIVFRVVEVPVSEIKINTNVQPDTEGGKYYTITGNLDIEEKLDDKESEVIVTSLSATWGKVSNNELVEFKLVEPTFSAGNLDLGTDNLLYPKPLDVTDKACEYRSLDTSILQIDENNNSTLIVKQINKEVKLQIISTYDSNVTDEITLYFIMPGYNFEWSEMSGATITKEELESGFNLNIAQIALEIVTGSDVVGSTKNALIKASHMVNNKRSIKFKLADGGVTNLMLIEDVQTDEYVGQVVKFKDLPVESGSFTITAYIETEDGLVFSKDYEFSIIADPLNQQSEQTE